jgi:putative DNA primase/helicase
MRADRTGDDTYARVADALRHIPADDRDSWLRIAMAVKSELGDSGFSIWDEWSRTADNYNERDARDVWRSIKSGPVQIGTLFHIARQHGYSAGKQPPAPASIPTSRPAPGPQRDTGAYAAKLWLRADFSDSVVADHPYAVKKGIAWAAGAGRTNASGRVIGRDADCIIVPIRNGATGKVQAVQVINAAGAKQTFGAIAGGCLVLGNTLDRSIPWYVAEGWASAVSVVWHHRKGNAVCGVAFGKSRMDETAEILATTFDPDEITILEEQ